MYKSKSISIHIVVPNHTKELDQIESIIEAINYKIKLPIQFNAKQIVQTESLKDELLITLNRLGRLSQDLFALEENLKAQYKIAYTNTPQLARILFQKHNTKLHKRYDLYKNRCFKMFEKLLKREKKLLNSVEII